MFTGIVSAMGTVTSVEAGDDLSTLGIEAGGGADGLTVGDSIAVNGVCLTAVRAGGAAFAVEAIPETMSRTNLGDLAPGSMVNLERPMAASGRFDGHLVQGHVDGVATVRSVTDDGESRRVWLDLGAEPLRYVVEKGSVALDGVSLTVTAVADEGFEVAVIPHTLDVTTLGSRAPGDRVNVEVDILAKYVERLLDARP